MKPLIQQVGEHPEHSPQAGHKMPNLASAALGMPSALAPDSAHDSGSVSIRTPLKRDVLRI